MKNIPISVFDYHSFLLSSETTQGRHNCAIQNHLVCVKDFLEIRYDWRRLLMSIINEYYYLMSIINEYYYLMSIINEYYFYKNMIRPHFT